MKHFRFLIIAAVAAVLGACQTEPADNGPATNTNNGKEVRINCSIEGSRVATEINMRKSFFQNGDRIALDVMRRPIYMTDPITPTYDRRDKEDFYLHNALMEYQDGEWLFVNAGTKIILEEGFRYDYYAYYPGNAATNRDPQVMEYSSRTTTSSDYIPHADLLWASHATTDADDYNNLNITLNFKHLVSMIEVRQVGLGMRASVKLRSDQNITLNGTFDMGTGVFATVPAGGAQTNIEDDNDPSGSGYKTITPSYGKEATFMAMDNGRYVLYMPPQSFTSNVDFKTYIETVPDISDPGVYYRYPLLTENPDETWSWSIAANESLVRRYDEKLLEPDVTTGLMKYEHLMYAPNSILLNTAGVSASVPVGKAYAMWLYDQTLNGGTPPYESLYGAVSLKMLWSDQPDFEDRVSVAIDDPSTGAKARINARIIEDGDLYEGNAVYGLYIGDELRWSWHIWVNSVQNPASTQGINGNIRFMRSNLGAGSSSNPTAFRGLLYQWGRKDPFPGADRAGWDFTAYQPVYDTAGVQINASLPYGVAVSSLTTLVQGVQNPTTFSSTWNPTATNLWDVPYTGAADYSDKKSPYDPCPIGWRIPRTETESAFYLAGAGNDYAQYTDLTWTDNAIRLKQGTDYSIGTYPQTNHRTPTGAFSTDEVTAELWHGGVAGNSFYVADKAAPNIDIAGQDNTLAKGKAVRCMRDIRDVQNW